MDGRRTPPGSPPSAAMGGRRRSSGFLYPTVGISGAPTSRTVYYDAESGLLPGAPNPAVTETGNAQPAPQPTRTTPQVSKTHKYQPQNTQQQRSRRDLEAAKRVIDNRDREGEALREEIERLKLELSRRAQQAKQYCESEAAVKNELVEVKSQVEDQIHEINDLYAHLEDLQSKGQLASQEIQVLRAENERLKRQLEESVSQLTALSDQFRQAVQHAEDAERIQREDKALIKQLRTELASLRSQVNTFERTAEAQLRALQAMELEKQALLSSNKTRQATAFKELLVQVALPGGTRAEFLVRLDEDDPRAVAEDFALRHQLSREATRVLVAFAMAEARARYA